MCLNIKYKSKRKKKTSYKISHTTKWKKEEEKERSPRNGSDKVVKKMGFAWRNLFVFFYICTAGHRKFIEIYTYLVLYTFLKCDNHCTVYVPLKSLCLKLHFSNDFFLQFFLWTFSFLFVSNIIIFLFVTLCIFKYNINKRKLVTYFCIYKCHPQFYPAWVQIHLQEVQNKYYVSFI